MTAGMAGALVLPGWRADSAQAAPLVREAEPWAKRLIDAARAQIGVTLRYDPVYMKLEFPNGDVPLEIGVCTDVVVRAYRTGLGFDLQSAIHKDMTAAFRAYPDIWGLSGPDPSIDHRRVPNQARFLARQGAALPVPDGWLDFLPGDLVTQVVTPNRPHIVIVSDRLTADGSRPLVIHNIGRGTQEEDSLAAWPVTGRYRFAAGA